MTDIVERLRNFAVWNSRHQHYDPVPLCQEAAAEIEQLRAMADDKITWRPVTSAPKQERVLLYAPPENLSEKPDQEPEYRVARAVDFCWATLWMRIKPPITAAPMVKRTTHG